MWKQDFFKSRSFKKSQNQRVLEPDRHLWKPSSPASYSEQVWLQQVFETISSQDLSISKDCQSTNSLGNLLHYLTNWTVNILFSLCGSGFSHFNVSPLPLVPTLGTTEKSWASGRGWTYFRSSLDSMISEVIFNQSDSLILWFLVWILFFTSTPHQIFTTPMRYFWPISLQPLLISQRLLLFC